MVSSAGKGAAFVTTSAKKQLYAVHLMYVYVQVRVVLRGHVCLFVRARLLSCPCSFVCLLTWLIFQLLACLPVCLLSCLLLACLLACFFFVSLLDSFCLGCAQFNFRVFSVLFFFLMLHHCCLNDNGVGLNSSSRSCAMSRKTDPGTQDANEVSRSSVARWLPAIRSLSFSAFWFSVGFHCTH